MDELKEVNGLNAKKKLNKVLKEVKQLYPNPNHKYNSIAAFGCLIDEVNDLVNQENMDIVVMATRGETNDRGIIFGSHTLQVLKYINAPVLAIPEGYKYHAPKKVLFSTNYLVPYKERELKLLCDMSGSFRSNIHMLYMDPAKKLSHRQEDHQELLRNCLPKANLIFETTPEKDKTIAITKYIVHNDIDMLILVNSRHSYLEDILYQSTIDNRQDRAAS